MSAVFEIEVTDDAERFLMGLDSRTFKRVAAAIDQLEAKGPTLGRPLVDQIKGRRHHNLKELRVGTVRIIFAFDPNRTGLLLAGGDKAGQWTAWYRTALDRAEALLDEHLAKLKDTG